MGIYNKRKFKGNAGFSVSLRSTRDSDGSEELSKLADYFSQYYKNNIDPDANFTPIPIKDGTLYQIYSMSKGGYLGSIKIKLKGSFAKNPDQDYAISDGTNYHKKYSIFINPEPMPDSDHQNPELRDILFDNMNF